MEINETKITNLEVHSRLYDCRMSCGMEIYESPECAHDKLHIEASDSYGRTWLLKGFAPDGTITAGRYLASDGQEKADRKIEKIQAHLDAGGTLNPDCWVEGTPSYGSEAYQASDTEATLCMMEKEGLL